ncbi:MAG: Hsp20/alpha crystallin family protein [Polaromonas sp.]|uniref:Hsp20/alpha crystallin family protein n=1 Tax=Polaromonas sp. TaxID=1869339 RepID=UPI00273174D4|nr:Hsp20/alpha crystallin family protein [Polaromonas sp.]MDZ4358754.1 Hsp20/alpha crystallin family protein [Variovorax sp.]MDP1742032.1 Hsp20/alpha crystallin family protein [Polaromonas sp.]MDP1954811.1 Hsp20/alpha crystallin family protein [Polaromonas sp.]MDP3354828.1 Hsp20/alpha crystallin family protein [Polaromonas sp.]MDP3753413.1 Hsp20/alpha crystallin family protein [Polaromonas sp.]
MFRSLFPHEVFAEMDRLQREVQQALDLSPNIRGFGRGGFPALNVGGTPQTVEVYAFAPGIDPNSLEVDLERGMLTIAGERKSSLPEATPQSTLHINERFAGAFRRVISLPEDADPDAVEARVKDGLVHITIQRRAAAQPRRITVH